MLWLNQIIFFRTDYLTSLWRPIILIGMIVSNQFAGGRVIAESHQLGASFLQMLTWLLLFIPLEVLHYRQTFEQAKLYMKMEESKTSEQSTKNMIQIIPDAILITDRQKSSKVNFYNDTFFQLLKTFIKQPGQNYATKFKRKMLTSQIFVPFQAS